MMFEMRDDDTGLEVTGVQATVPPVFNFREPPLTDNFAKTIIKSGY